MRDEAEVLADLLDGRLGPHEVPPELAELAGLAQAVRTHVTAPLPTPDFRTGLRDQLVEGTGGQAAAAGGAGGAAAAASGTGWVGSLVAGVTAAAVLAGGGIVVAADGAVPGDALYGTKQRVEQLQLAVAGPDREAELLVEHATQRVREAIALPDTSLVPDLLTTSVDLVDRALALVDPARLEDQLATYTGMLRVLASRTDDVGVQATVAAIVGGLTGQSAPVAPELPPVGPSVGEQPSAPSGSATPPGDGDGGAPAPGTPGAGEHPTPFPELPDVPTPLPDASLPDVGDEPLPDEPTPLPDAPTPLPGELSTDGPGELTDTVEEGVDDLLP